MTIFNNFQVFLFFFLTFRIKIGKKDLSFKKAGWQNGLCRGLQILLYWFDSGTGLQKKTYL